MIVKEKEKINPSLDANKKKENEFLFSLKQNERKINLVKNVLMQNKILYVYFENFLIEIKTENQEYSIFDLGEC